MLRKIDLVRRFCNGDVRQSRLVHYELACGQCGSREKAVEHFTAAVTSTGILLPAGCLEPSINRWGHLDESMRQQAPGMLVHNLSGQALKKAFPKPLQSDSDTLVDEDADYRAYIRSKSSRATGKLNCPMYQARMFSAMWTGRPMMWLWHRLEWLDERGNALAEVITPHVSPVNAVQEQLFKMMSDDPSALDLGTLWYHFQSRPRQLRACMEEVFQIASSAYAQHHWRFVVPLGDTGLSVVRLAAGPEAERRAAVEALYGLPQCCLEPKLAGKMRALFGGPQQMLEDPHWWMAVQAFSRHSKVCNMHVERMLAVIRQSIAHSNPLLERVCANGMLAQCLHQHLSAGGDDPRHEMSETLLADGVPLARELEKRETRPKGRKRSIPAHLAYANAQPVGLRRDAMLGFKDLPPAEQAHWKSMAREAAVQRSMQSAGEPSSSSTAAAESLSDVGSRPMLGLSDGTLPIGPMAFEIASGASSTSSFASWGLTARQEFQDKCFIKDAGDIPRSARVAVSRCCHQLHFGVCKHVDQHNYSMLLKAGTALWKHMWDGSWEFHWVQISIARNTALEDPVDSRASWYWLAHYRGADPRICLFIQGYVWGSFSILLFTPTPEMLQ